MKKKFRLENLDCAHCAEKMSEEISKIHGVEKCNISFIAQRMTIVADEENFDRIMGEAQKIVAKIEPDCKIVE
ncbi:MAG: heavy-metal-associated domain-containing protein [Christensenellales bacterium]|jgi:copper chaperone CopZ